MVTPEGRDWPDTEDTKGPEGTWKWTLSEECGRGVHARQTDSGLTQIIPHERLRTFLENLQEINKSSVHPTFSFWYRRDVKKVIDARNLEYWVQVDHPNNEKIGAKFTTQTRKSKKEHQVVLSDNFVLPWILQYGSWSDTMVLPRQLSNHSDDLPPKNCSVSRPPDGFTTHFKYPGDQFTDELFCFYEMIKNVGIEKFRF
jgi:hypothetical protein